jgi:hypothetical protein
MFAMRRRVRLLLAVKATLFAATAAAMVAAQETRATERPTGAATLRIAGSREVDSREELFVAVRRRSGPTVRERLGVDPQWPPLPWAHVVKGNGFALDADASYRVELRDAFGALPGASVEVPPTAAGETRRVVLTLPPPLGDVRIRVPAFAGDPGGDGRSHFVRFRVAPEVGWPDSLRHPEDEASSKVIARDGSVVLGPVYRPQLAAWVACRHGVGRLLVAPSADASRPPLDMPIEPSRRFELRVKSPGGGTVRVVGLRFTDRNGVPVPVGHSAGALVVPQVELVAHGVVFGRPLTLEIPSHAASHEAVVEGLGEIVFRRAESRPDRDSGSDVAAVVLRPVRVPAMKSDFDGTARGRDRNWFRASGQEWPPRKDGGRVIVWEGVWEVQAGDAPAVEVTVRSGESVELAVR